MADQEIKPSPFEQAFYRLARGTCWIYFKLGWRLKVHGVENIPVSGGVILAANHRSYADPPLVGVSLERPIHFLAKEELFRFRPFGRLISALNAHPLKRSGSDIGAMKAAKKILEGGDIVIVFPEGRRNRSNTLGTPKAGVGLLAKLTDCPIVPVYIDNSAEMIAFRKISVHFGNPIAPEKFGSNQELADEVMARINRLKEDFRKPRIN